MTPRDHAGRSIDDAEDALVAAMRISDLVALDKLISDDLKFIGPDGGELTKEADLEAHRTGATNFDRIDETDRRTLELDGTGTTDTTALVVLRLDAELVTMEVHWHRQWQINNGFWQVIGGSATVRR